MTPEPGARRGGSLRVRLDLGYDGTGFSGWALQPGRRTVAGVLLAGLATVLRTPGDDLGLVVAGRTDAGVHAIGQVCHVDVPATAWAALPGRADLPPATALLRRLRGVLPVDVRVHGARPAPEGFDARFSAFHRRYAYRLSVDPAGVPPLRRHDVVGWPRPLDERAMAEAAAPLVGLHDFAPFCKRREGATTIRTLLALSVAREGDVVTVTASADAFCHSMVRSLVGALLAVGEGRRDPGWPAALLDRRTRADEVVVAPPGGLTLVRVDYPDDADLAARVLQTRALRG